MRRNRWMAWRDRFPALRRMAHGGAAVVLAAVLTGGRASADPVALVATQPPTAASSFTLDFGGFGGVASARISQTDLALEIDADRGTAQFTQYLQFVDPLILPGDFSTGNIRVEIVPGSSAGVLNVLTGKFATEELYAVYFDGDLSAFDLTSPVYLPSASAGTVNLSFLRGGDINMAWVGTGQLINPFEPSTFITFEYTCAVQTAFAPEPVTLLQLALIPNVINLSLPLGLENSFLTTLESALESINVGRNRHAINALNTFIRKVEAQRGLNISDPDVDLLVSDAEGTILLLGTGVTTAWQPTLGIDNGQERNVK